MASVIARMEGPFVWGVSDCCLAAADVVRDLVGVDPMAELRGTYSTAGEARDRLLAAGGYEAGLRAAGFRPVSRPEVGDVGLTWCRAMAVCVGDRWAAKTERGLLLVRSVRRAWRLA